MDRIHYFLGRFSIRYRAWYWKRHHHGYLWGLYNYICDSQNNELLFPLTLSDEIEIEICKNMLDRNHKPK